MATAVGYGQRAPSGRRWGRFQPIAMRVRRFLRFGLVGISGVLVNEAALAAFVAAFHVNILLGALLATQCSTAWNFALVEWWAFESAGKRSGRGHRFLMFWAVNLAALGLRGPILALLTSELHVHYLISNIVSLGVLVVLRFAIADSLIWGKVADPAHPVGPDDLLAHLPRDLAEDLGWALNPVGEAADLVVPADDSRGTTGAPPVIVEREAQARTHDHETRPGRTEVPRFGTINPTTLP